jgi:hypothetical protein
LSLALWLAIELFIVAFFGFGWFLWHRRTRHRKPD